MLHHDASLQRTADLDESVLELPLSRLREIEVNERRRLGDAFHGVRLPTLSEAVDLTRTWHRAQAFIEIKAESIRRFGIAAIVRPVIDAIEAAADRCIIISFDIEACRAARSAGAQRIGWVLPRFDAATRRQAVELSPEFLFCDRLRIEPGDAVWRGPWRWAVYEVTDPDAALAWAARGVELVETMAVKEMLADSRLATRSCLGEDHPPQPRDLASE